MSQLLSVEQAAERANVSPMTIRRRIKDKTLPTVTQGVRTLIRSADLERIFSGNPAPAEPCRVIAIANQKGGVGKTTTAANVAAALSHKGYSVLAVDCDPQGNLTMALGPDPDTLDITLFNVLVESVDIHKAILNPVLGEPRLSLVGANLELSAADPQLAGVVAREMRLRRVLEPCLKQFDFILLDCPPTLGLLTLNALSAATEVIIPADVGVFSLRGVSQLMGTIAEVRNINPALSRVRTLSSKATNTNLSAEIRELLREKFGGDLLQTVIRQSIKVSEAQAAKCPITVYRPNDPTAKDYFQLAEELTSGA